MEDDAPPGVPEWVVTYGDMMSLLLTFFIMLVSLSEVKANKKYLAVLQSLQSTLGYRAGPIAPPGDYFPLNSLVETESMLGSYSPSNKGKRGIKAPQTPDGEDIRVFMPRHGEAVPAGEFILFRPFEADLNEEAQRRIATVVRQLAGKPNKVEVCGHTSSRKLPEQSPYATLLQLSYARGRVVYDALVSQGVEPERLRIVAFADHAPLPASHDAHELNEDRVEVLILDAYQSEYIGPRDAPQRP